MFFGKNNQYFQLYKEEYKVFQKKFVSSLFIIKILCLTIEISIFTFVKSKNQKSNNYLS